MHYYSHFCTAIFLFITPFLCAHDYMQNDCEYSPALLEDIDDSKAIGRPLCGTSDHLVLEKNQHIMLESLVAMRAKLDNLEKQQRDFLVLISDIVMKPNHPRAAQELTDYQNNLDLMKAQQYGQSLKLWKKFIQDYPESEKIAYAYYWIGELYALDHKPDAARSSYQQLIDEHPSHSKTPEAFLKIGQMAASSGDLAQSKIIYHTLIDTYPHSQAAHLAKKMLAESLQKEKSLSQVSPSKN